MSFLVARPDIKAQITCDALISAGCDATAAPVLKIKSIDNHLLVERLQQTPFHIIVITSTYAASWLCKQALTTTLDASKIICIGKSTAAVISKSFPNITCHVAQPQNSEGALTHPVLYDVKGSSVLLLKGEGGRDLIAEVLTKRGAFVSSEDVYKRCNNPDFKLVDTLSHAAISCIIVTSVEIAQLIVNTQQVTTQDIHKLHWMVASQRIKDYAIDQGITRITISDGASTQAIVKCACHLQSTGALNV